ncbi:multimerin-2-like [Echeneis naucrates]|uniref:Multimerin-2-like n=1 Tax=Echeneis naucrates TaxID=173247 RepID=A0A665UC69_ECHNA|nr:multimerin-2-like [Echeneis naucrates]
MTAVGELVLVLGLLVGAHCEVRARDPEVEHEELGGRAAAGGEPGGAHLRATEPPPLGDRIGYKVSSQPQKCCCPGLGGTICEDAVPDLQLDSGSSPVIGQFEPERTEPQGPEPNAAVMALVTSVLQSFNQSLEQLSRQVRDLVQDVAQLKASQQGPEQQMEPLDGPELHETLEEQLGARLDQVSQEIRDIQRQMDSQQRDVESRLHSQHAMLHYNLTSFKTDVDMKLKRNQKMLQLSLRAVNSTLSDLNLGQTETLPPGSLLPDSSALWEAIERLDNMVINNTVKVDGLAEDMEVTLGSNEQVRRDLKDLESQIKQASRHSQILFMETGLEVEDAKMVVLRRVEELATNQTQHHKLLMDMEVDVNYLYANLYNHSAVACDCTGLSAAISRLERGVANVTALANNNRLALDENNEEADQWGTANDWEPVVEAIRRGLQQLGESVVSQQTKIRTLERSLIQLSASLKAEVSRSTERDVELQQWMQHLSSSFQSLLDDVIRHSIVLELLLGDEVLDFLDRLNEDQKTDSILALKEQLRNLKENVIGHNLSITSLLGNRPGDDEAMLSADQPSAPHLPPDEWRSAGVRRSRGGEPFRERQLLLSPDRKHPAHRGDGSNLWNLEKLVEQLQLRLLHLEEKPCSHKALSEGGVDAKLQAEVTWLKRGLEQHLRMFKNIFSNADVLANSNATLELDKLWQLLAIKGGKREKRLRGVGGSGRGANHHNKRVTSGVSVPSSQSDNSVLFVARPPLSISSSIIVFQSLNQTQFYSETGTFTTPLDGIYLLIVTLDLRPGPSHLVLRRRSGEVLMSLHQQKVKEAGPATGVSLLLLKEGEVVSLELRGGIYTESEDNVFIGLLLHRTT